MRFAPVIEHFLEHIRIRKNYFQLSTLRKDLRFQNGSIQILRQFHYIKDRIIVLAEGRITGELMRPEFSQEKILSMASVE